MINIGDEKMRDKNILKLLDDITILNKYLYMSDEHSIEYNNGLTTLEIRMDSDLNLWAVNKRFPELPPLYFTGEMTLGKTLSVIEFLKTQKSKYAQIKNKWEEIKEITMANLALNPIR